MDLKGQTMWNRFSGDAASGKLLAASDFFPAAPAATVPVGYGGLIYDLLNNGHIMALQVLPASTAPSAKS